MSFADYVRKRKSGEISASEKEEKKPVETAGPETNFAEYVKKRRSGEIPAPVKLNDYNPTAANVLGQYGRGNIDLFNRPQYKNPDGTVSTVRSMSFGTDEGEILVPTIGFDKDGKPYSMSEDEAIDNYYKTGQYLGKFKSVQEADNYANLLHKQQEAYYHPHKETNIFSDAIEAYKNRVDMSKLKYRDGLNPNQTIGNAKGTFTPSTPEPANLTREGQWAAKHPIAGTGMYAVTNLVGGGEGVANAIDAAVRSATGKGKLKASEIKSAPLAQAYRTGVSEGVRNYVETSDENLPKVLRTVGNIKQGDGQYSSGEQALDFLTGVGTDAASSALGMAMGGNMFTYLMGTNAANQSLYDTANDEKTTSGQALALAAANGIAEAFFEKFSVENAGAVQEMFRRNPVSVKDFAKALVVSAGVEGSEEINTEIANILSDIFIRGENSESGRMYANAVRNGADPNAAAAEVLRANLKQIGMAGLGGALSGGLHTGVFSAAGTMQRGMDLQNSLSAADIRDSIDTSTEEGQTAYKIASDLAEKEASGKRATAIDYGRLQNAIDNAVEAASEITTEETVTTTEETTKEKVPTTEVAAPTTETTAPTTEEATEDVEIREVPRGDFRSSDAIRQTAENVKAQMDADYQEAFNEMYGADTEGIRNRGGDIEGTKENKRSYHIPVETLARVDEDNRNNKTYSGLGKYGQETFDTQSFGRDAYDSATSLYNSIRFGQDLTEAEKMRNARLLTDDQVFKVSQAAFKDLNSFYNWDRAGKISAMAEKHTLKDVTPGKVTYADGIDIDALRADGSEKARKQVAQMAYAEGLLSKVFGYNVNWFQSEINDNTGTYEGANGFYDPSTHTINLDINAGANYVGDTIKYSTVIAHELTHTLELGAVEQYKKIADSVMNILVNDEEYSRGRNAQQIIADMIENNPHVHNESEAVHELVAQACEDMMSGNADIQEMLAGLTDNERQSLFDRISNAFASILKFIEDMLSSDAVKSDRREAEALRRAKEEIEGLRDTWNEGVKNAAIATKFADLGVVEGDGNVSAENSERSWSNTDKQKLLEALVEAGYDKKKAQKWIRDVSSISAMIAADRNRLDYVAAENQTMLKPNQEYIKTLDASTLCAKRQLYQGTYNAIQRMLPNTPLLSEEVIRIRGLLNEHGLESPCGICYVESRRRNLGRFASRWLNTYEGEYKPTIAEVTSTDGLENLRKTHPDTYADYIAAMKKKGVSNPKVVELRTDYRGEINNLTKGQIEKITRIGGLRVQSFSDFETVHTIDMMQAVLDMAANGLTAQAYTKVPAFAAIFGNTGIKINLSLIGDVDENGNLTFDDKEGINHEEAFKLRKKYGKNVGTILVGRNDAHILAAMADPRIDFIIPFHRSGWGKRQFAQLGLDNYTDYTKSQNEKNLDGSKIKDGNLYPIDYWDYSKSGKENAERYLEICAEQGRIPKFSQFLTNNHDGSWSLKEDGSTDGYWKLLIDFKMYDNNGVGAPQEKVTGQFNMTEARKILDSFDGNADSLPVAQEVVDEFVKEFKEKHPRKQYSSRDIETAADDPNDTSVIRMGSEKDIKYSTRFARGINDKLRVHMGTFFAGTGTVDFALRNIVSHQFAVEYDAKIAALYKLNNNGGTVYADDVRNVKVDPYKGRVEYFHASPVCKSYSGANNDSGEKPLDIETARATARAIEELNPKVVTIENVARYRNSNAIKIIEEALTKNGYTFDKGVYKATDFGGATIRERMFIRAVKDGVLPDINEYKEAPKSWYSVVEDLIDKLPEEPLSNYMEERLEASGIDIDNLTQPVLVLGGNKGEKLTYAYADKPSPTIIANSTESRILMPDGRVLRAVPRVLARIQGLPDDFDLGLKDEFDMKKSRGSVTRAYTVVGNGVTTQLTEGVFEPLLKANIIDRKSQETGISYSSRNNAAEATEDSYESMKRNGYTSAEAAEAVEAGGFVQYSTRTAPPPKKTITAYKAFYAIDGKLYPPMVANDVEEEQNKGKKKVSGTLKGLETPVGIWIDADVGALAYGDDGKPLRNTKGRLAVKNAKGGGTLAFRPGWHLGLWPDAKQFNVKDPVTGELKACMPDGLVFARCSVSADNDYQLEALGYGMKGNGKFDRTQAGLPRVPVDGYYMYRTNVDPTTAPWIISGAIRVEEILDDDMAAEICKQYGITADPRASHKKIDLSNYGLKAGPVTPTEDTDRFLPNEAVKRNASALEEALNDPEYANAYVANSVNFDDPEIVKELARNGQSAEFYKAAQAKYGNKSYAVNDPNDSLIDKDTFKQYSTRDNITSRDSEGTELTKAQQEYFKDSKVRDKDGNLMVVYHGTPRGDFTVFDDSRIGSSTDYGWYGKGFYFTDKESAAKYYAGYLRTSRVMKGYLNITNPYELNVPKGESVHRVMVDAMGKIYDSAEEQAEAFTEWLKDNEYDGLITKGQYMIFDSNQFKNIDNQNPTENEDIRYSTRDNTINGYTPSSIGSIEELMRYNSGIRDMSAGLAAALESKGAQGAKLSDAQVERIARKFIKEYGSEADPKMIAGGLKSMFDYIDMTSKVSASQLGKIAHDYAKEILEKATEENTFGNQYPDLKKGFKTANLKLTEELKGDIINTYGSVPNFKRQMRGILDISEKGTQGVDTYYEELKGLHPDLFTDGIINPADQLEKIAEVAELINQKRVKSDFGSELDENAYVLGQEMVAQYFAEKGDSRYKREVDEIKTEMTKKHQAEMAELRADAAKEYQKLKDRLGSKAMKVAEVRAELNAMHRRVMERRELRLLTKEAKIRLMKQAKALWKLKGSAEFESAKRDLIGNLDLVSFGMSDGTRLNLEKIRKDALTQAAQDPDYAMSVEFADAQKLFERLNKQRISDMSLEQIESLTKAVLALKNSQQTYNRMLKEELGDYVADYGSRLITQQQLISGIRGKSHMMNALKRYALYMENPTRAAHLLDGYQQNGVFTELFDDINEGAIRAESFRQRSDEMFRPVLEDKELNRTWSKQDIPIKVGSDTYYISKGMRIAIYLHSLNNDNMRHVKKGGFTIPDEKLYRQGRYTEAYAAGKRVPMSEGTVREIISEMTPAERKFAGVAKEFFNSVTKDAINEVSLQLKGFELAMVNNYMPIRTNPNFTQREIEGLVRDGTIEGAGQFKDRVPGASNPILLEDIAQVIKRQTDTTALYYGLAIPVRNANKVWNFTSHKFHYSVKDAVAHNWLTDGAKIFENTLTDIQAGARRGDTSRLFSFFKGAYAAAVLTANIGVSLKQSASYPLAIHMLDAASLAKGLKGKLDREYMDSITPLSWARRHGMGGQVEVADVFRQKGMIDENTALQWAKNATNWIQAVDVFTTDRLFVACEEYVKDHNPGLEVRGDEYNKMVADLYNDVLQRTQPSYGVMQRNEWLRSSSEIRKAFTMFKTQTFNMGGELLDAGLRVQALSEMQKKGQVTKEEVNGAKRNMANVVGATIISQAMLAVLSTVANAFLHKMKPYRDDEGEVTPESVTKKTAQDFATSFFGLFYGADFISEFATAVTGGKWYDVTAPQLDGINDATAAISKWSEAVSKAFSGEGSRAELVKQTGNMAIKISGAFGIPANNVYNIANAINLWVQDGRNHTLFESGESILGINDTGVTDKQYYNRMWASLYVDKDWSKFITDYNRMVTMKDADTVNSKLVELLSETDEVKEAAAARRAGNAAAVKSAKERLGKWATGKAALAVLVDKAIDKAVKASEPKEEKEKNNEAWNGSDQLGKLSSDVATQWVQAGYDYDEFLAYKREYNDLTERKKAELEKVKSEDRKKEINKKYSEMKREMAEKAVRRSRVKKADEVLIWKAYGYSDVPSDKNNKK